MIKSSNSDYTIKGCDFQCAANTANLIRSAVLERYKNIGNYTAIALLPSVSNTIV